LYLLKLCGCSWLRSLLPQLQVGSGRAGRRRNWAPFTGTMKQSSADAPEFRVITAVADTLFPCLEADAAEAEEHGFDKIAVFMRTSGASPTVTKEVRVKGAGQPSVLA